MAIVAAAVVGGGGDSSGEWRWWYLRSSDGIDALFLFPFTTAGWSIKAINSRPIKTMGTVNIADGVVNGEW